ncbi:MAG: hypothetical protein ABSB22_24380 [Thermodesulfobacteriota bacterium]
MKRIMAFCLLLAFVTIACEKKPLPSPEKSEVPSVTKVIVDKERIEQEQPLPAEVKIKLKKDGKDNYSWELSGSDPDQILKVNEKLRKKLGGERPK